MRLVALGDSFSCGEGVGTRLPPAQSWVGRTAQMLGADLEVRAVPGATVRDVRRDQLCDVRADLVTLLAGINDTIRAGFDPVAIRGDLAAILASIDAPVLVGSWHDPTEQFRLPGYFADALRRRVGAVNKAIDDVAPWRFALADVPELRDPAGWAVDRVHPSAFGHDAIARHVVGVLGGVTSGPVDRPVPGRFAHGRWLVRYGTPWLALRLRKVAVPVAALALQRRGAEPGPRGGETGGEQGIAARAVAGPERQLVQ